MTHHSPELVSIHEASHAVAGQLVGMRALRIDMVQIGSQVGCCMVDLREAFDVATSRDLIVIHVAGVAGERIFTGEPGRAVMADDAQAAYRVASRIHGMFASTEAVEAEVNAALSVADRLLRQNWSVVVALADDLRRLYSTLDTFRNSLLFDGWSHHHRDYRPTTEQPTPA